MKNYCIVNAKIKNSKLTLEFLYKEKKISDNIKVYLEAYSNAKHYGTFVKNDCIEKDGTVLAKITFSMELKEYGTLKLKMEEEDNTYDIHILDNKNEEILEYNEPYIIFTEKYCIKIGKEQITIIKRKFGSKLKYELHKQMYSIKAYKKISIFRLFKGKNKYFLFNDRLLFGDDNAEQLFKYINENEKEFAKRCYFVLDKNSNSINRIKKVGKVLKYGSFMHKLKFLNCKMVVSSHASYYDNCFNPFNETEMKMYKDIITKQFVFIQHGVVMNDIHRFVNRCRITADLYITSTYDEYEYLKRKEFMYEDNMIIKTGLPRFDKLKNEDKKNILIAPTWRENLSTKQYDGNGKKNFSTSEYYKRYKNLLTNQELKNVLKENGYKIKFLLHPAFTEVKDTFIELQDDLVEILNIKDIQYSKLFNECSMLITDYSSIHFDVATLKKPIIYYQFDKNDFFGNHYEHGYFNYETDGFGEVIEEEQEVLDKIKRYILNNCEIEEQYREKIEETFIFLDKNNSKRVYEEIVKLAKEKQLNYRFNNTH